MDELGMNDEFCSLLPRPAGVAKGATPESGGHVRSRRSWRDRGGASTSTAAFDGRPRSGFVRRGVVP
jgi:hypothetical protein